MSKLFYIVGASGAGKDSLINYCRDHINGSLPILFAHRYITRPATAVGENHIYLSPEEFRLRHQQGLFALHWESHGLCYGIGIEIDSWLNKGFNVVVNGSREYLKNAMGKYPTLQPVLIEADAELIRERLHSRQREDHEKIAGRIARNQQLELPDTNITRIANNTTLADAATQLFNILLPANNYTEAR